MAECMVVRRGGGGSKVAAGNLVRNGFSADVISITTGFRPDEVYVMASSGDGWGFGQMQSGNVYYNRMSHVMFDGSSCYSLLPNGTNLSKYTDNMSMSISVSGDGFSIIPGAAPGSSYYPKAILGYAVTYRWVAIKY